MVSKGEVVNNKSAGPAGFNSYVGNAKYGQWTSDGNGGSFWRFYGQYMFMSQMFGLMTRPAYYSHHNDYYSNYRYSRAYYGPRQMVWADTVQIVHIPENKAKFLCPKI